MGAQEEIREDVEGARYREALARINEESLDDPESNILRARALLGLERYDDAFREIRGVLSRELEDDDTRLEAEALRVKCMGILAGLNDALVAALELQDDAIGSDAPKHAAEACLEAAWHYARKRCRPLVDAQLAKARELDPTGLDVELLDGFVRVMFDERLEALAAYTRARDGKSDTPRVARTARSGLARVHYLLGDFAAAHRELDALRPFASSDLRARRALIEVLSAEKRWEEVAAVYEEIGRISPRSDYALYDRLSRATALYRAGKLDDAVAGLERIVSEADDARDGQVADARALLGKLTREGAKDLPRHRLYAFPSVAQLRNHCGPASCELYMRFFGLRADQVEIAREIKFPNSGTPVYRMRTYLEHAGFHTRRIEAELPMLRALIDHKIPIILEEDYSTSRHVAVAIGYDDVREVLEVQDPMTHSVRETPYEELARIQAFSNAGALVGVPKDKPELMKALDEAGAKDCEYIALADKAWAAYDEKKFDEGDALIEQSLAIRRDYELSWIYKFQRAMRVVEESPSGDARVNLHRIVAEAQAIWPDDEWPQVLAGDVAYSEDRIDEALPAFLRARDRDPADTSNWSRIADCHLSRGDLDAAKDALLETLARDPAHVRAGENLAYVCAEQGELERARMLSEVARTVNPDNPVNVSVLATILFADRDFDGALEAHARVAEMDPPRAAHSLVTRVRTLAKLGRFEEAEALLTGLPDDHPKKNEAPYELGFMLFRARAFDRVLQQADVLEKLDPRAPSGPALKGAARVEMGEIDRGIAELDEALARFPGFGWAHNKKGRALTRKDKLIEAIGSLSAAVTTVPNVAEYRFDLGDALARAGSGHLAAGHLKQAMDSGDLGEAELVRAGEILVDVDGPQRTHGFFQSLEEKFPCELPVYRAHAKTIFEPVWMPNSGANVLREISDLDEDDPYGRLQAGLDHFESSMEAEAEGEAEVRKAIEEIEKQERGLAFPRRLFAERLTSLGRYPEALEVLAPLGTDYMDTRARVEAFTALDRHDEAIKVIEAFEQRFAEDGAPAPAGAMLRYQLARSRGEYEEALKMARAAGQMHGESHDDGRLDEWELEEFDCLLALGRVDDAIAFGLQQAGDGEALGRLAHRALLNGRVKAAASLADKALRLAPNDAYAIHTLGRAAEIEGRMQDAIALYRRAGEVEPDWHAWLEELARLALADGDLERAREHATSAIEQDGHTCFFAVGVHTQVHLLSGDVARARELAKRARGLGLSDRRENHGLDIWGAEALLGGDLDRARKLFDAFLTSEIASAADRRRIERLWDARRLLSASVSAR